MTRTRYDAVLFDYGNTLTSYFSNEQWPGVLDRCMASVADTLDSQGLLRIRGDCLASAVQAQRGEQTDHAVRPLSDRLATIFELDGEPPDGPLHEALARAFLAPIFAMARLEPDVLPSLQRFRSAGVKLGILSNTPWGTPGSLWREELARHGLVDAVDAVVFCTDVGFRKPAPQGFLCLCDRLGVEPARTLFVGDDPRWDIAGPLAIGMPALLIDRTGGGLDTPVLTTLADLDRHML